MNNALVSQTTQLLAQVEPDFRKLAAIHGAVHFEREAAFALDLLRQNKYLADVAMNNPDSLKRAVLNVAAVGLSLSPVHKLAYLVPRGKQIVLDISARGFSKLATDSGAILFVQADVVCENDTFEFGEFGKPPMHAFNPLGERGKLLGAYCVAKTAGGDYLKTFMQTSEIRRIAETYSEAFKNKSGPWTTEPEEMFKKTVIKRAAKQWPSTTIGGLSKALEIEAETNPVALPPPENPPDVRSHSFDAIRSELKRINRDETSFLVYAQSACHRKLEQIEEMTDLEVSRALTFLKSLKPDAAKKAN